MAPTRRLSTRSRTSEASSYDNPAPTTATTQTPARRADRSGRTVRLSRALSASTSASSRSTGRRTSTAPRRISASESDIKREHDDSSGGAIAEGSRGGHRVNGVSGTKIRLRVGGSHTASGPSASRPGGAPSIASGMRDGGDVDDDELSSELSEIESAEYGDLPAVLLPPKSGPTSVVSGPAPNDGSRAEGSSRRNGRVISSPASSTDSAGESEYDPRSKAKSAAKSAAKSTSKAKGKGKARAGTVDQSSDTAHDSDSMPLSAAKRKRASQTGGKKRKASTASGDVVDLSSSQALTPPVPGQEPQAIVDAATKKRKLPDPDDALAAYSCPICFGTLEHPVMTLCGHLLCAKCLLDALIAAIKRNPDPTPGPRGNARGRGRGRGRGGRGGLTHSNFNPDHNNQQQITHPDAHPQGGPAEWTTESLRQAWYEHKVREIFRALPEMSGPENDAVRAQQLELAGQAVVQEQVKGLWMLEEGVYVVEGECPVCRKALPGGFGPPNSGIGGVIPLHVKAR